jgi:hypothetical protein
MEGVSTPAATSTPQRNLESVIKEMTVVVGEKGGDAFPILDRIWDVYSGKGIRTVFLSIGNSKSALADLEIVESLGCPLNVVPLTESDKSNWVEVARILKDRKRESSDSEFSVGSETKWILPKNMRVLDSIPFWENGTIDLSGYTMRTQKVNQFTQSIATTMKLKDNANRIDILKVDALSAPGLEVSILSAIMSAGFRPSLILVRWTKMPDVELSATLAAGHLQNCGYSLIGKQGDKFLYYFTDEDLYQICSWEGIVVNNPIVTEIIKASKTPTLMAKGQNSSS